MTKLAKRTRIKICGMTDPKTVAAAIDLGVDAIGMILHANSPRQIELEQAKLIRQTVPALVSLVGVFVDASADLITHYHQAIGLDLVQLHGDESPEFVGALGLPYVKAIRAKSTAQVSADISAHSDARALLLDPYVKGQHGGTGQTLDSALWPNQSELHARLILAGGLSPDNLVARMTLLSPYAVDLNSGLELSPGRKSIPLMAQAVRTVRAYDSQACDL